MSGEYGQGYPQWCIALLTNKTIRLQVLAHARRKAAGALPDADDAAQEVYAKACKDLREPTSTLRTRLDPLNNERREKQFIGWLVIALDNDALNRKRKSQRRGEHVVNEPLMSSPLESPENELSAKQTREALDSAFDELTPPIQTAIRLRLVGVRLL